MRCSQCQAENEEGSKFCGNCGAPLPAEQIYCTKCGAANLGDSAHCGNCGSKLAPQAGVHFQASGEHYAATKKKTSAAWWLMPIFLGWIGGLIAWAAVRVNNRGKARRLLFFGIAWSVLWVVITIVFVILVYFVYDFGISW